MTSTGDLYLDRGTACRLGYEEYDGSRYCFEHGGFAHYLMYRTLICDRRDRNVDR